MLECICERDDLCRLNLLFECGLRIEDYETKEKIVEIAKENGSTFVASRINEYTSNLCANVNDDGPLHLAIDEDNFDLVKKLIANGADVNARNKKGERPLHLAALSANLEIVNYLIEKGAMINCHDIYGRNAVEFALRSGDCESNAVVKKLIAAGARTDLTDHDVNTFLHRILINQEYDIAEYLLSYYPEINQLNIYGETYLNIAASRGPKYLLEKMIKAGADVNTKDNFGQTPLHKAIMSNTVEVVEFLLKKGAQVNMPTKKREYPIQMALKRFPNLPFVRILIRYGADPMVRDEKGVATVDLALQSRY